MPIALLQSASDAGDAGGFLVPEDLMAMIRAITEITPFDSRPRTIFL